MMTNGLLQSRSCFSAVAVFQEKLGGGAKVLNLPAIFEETCVLGSYLVVSIDSRCFS